MVKIQACYVVPRDAKHPPITQGKEGLDVDLVNYVIVPAELVLNPYGLLDLFRGVGDWTLQTLRPDLLGASIKVLSQGACASAEDWYQVLKYHTERQYLEHAEAELRTWHPAAERKRRRALLKVRKQRLKKLKQRLDEE